MQQSNGQNDVHGLSEPVVYFHSRHVCGHAVYWSDAATAFETCAWPCPWCGGEQRKQFPPDGVMLDCGDGVLCFQQLNEDGSVPAATPGEHGKFVVIQHRADETCCLPWRP